jgi:hypothetical protein
MADNPAADLGAMIEGRTDQEINEWVSSQGVDTVLGDIFNGMVAAFDPGAAGDQSAVIQHDVTAADGIHSYQLKVANGKCNVAKGGKEAARITLASSLPNFLRIIGGNLDGTFAVISGRLRVSGDMLFVQSTQTAPPWFKMGRVSEISAAVLGRDRR